MKKMKSSQADPTFVRNMHSAVAKLYSTKEAVEE